MPTTKKLSQAAENREAWRLVVEEPMPSIGEVTDATKRMTAAHSGRIRGSVRMSTNRVFTSREFERWRTKVYSKSLP